MEKERKVVFDPMAEFAKSIQRIIQNMTRDRVRVIAGGCRSFKIGKTGDKLEVRLNQDDYRSVYAHIQSVYSSKTPKLVDDMEAYLINEFYFFPNCDNKKNGFLSHSDPMTDSEDEYHVYVVWND